VLPAPQAGRCFVANKVLLLFLTLALLVDAVEDVAGSVAC